MRMTVPRGARDFGLDDPEPGRLGRSWVLLFGSSPALHYASAYEPRR